MYYPLWVTLYIESYSQTKIIKAHKFKVKYSQLKILNSKSIVDFM